MDLVAISLKLILFCLSIFENLNLQVKIIRLTWVTSNKHTCVSIHAQIFAKAADTTGYLLNFLQLFISRIRNPFALSQL